MDWRDNDQDWRDQPREAAIDECLFRRIPVGTPRLKLLSNSVAMSRDDNTIIGRHFDAALSDVRAQARQGANA